jgi:lysophospholipase L1-like esterase
MNIFTHKLPKHWIDITLRLVTLSAVFSFVLTVAVPPASAGAWGYHRKRVVVGMGDSFTSGEGLTAREGVELGYEPGTDTPANTCHRAYYPYPRIAAALTGAYEPGSDLNQPQQVLQIPNVACSGAKIDDMFQVFKTEQPQISRINGVTDIFLTIGGNDVNAVNIALGVERPSKEEIANRLTVLRPRLVDAYKRIQFTAPRARIFVMGYPNIAPDAKDFNPDGCLLLFRSADRQGDLVYLQDALRDLDNTIHSAATEAKVNYVDTYEAFKGHEACTSWPWVNNILHPNDWGHLAMGVQATKALKR